MKINLNQLVSVRLTEYGMALYREYLWRCKLPVDYDADSKVTLPLRELMSVFGTSMFHGNPKVAFENSEITITDFAVETPKAVSSKSKWKVETDTASDPSHTSITEQVKENNVSKAVADALVEGRAVGTNDGMAIVELVSPAIYLTEVYYGKRSVYDMCSTFWDVIATNVPGSVGDLARKDPEHFANLVLLLAAAEGITEV